MSHARLCVELPPDQWKATVTREFPDTTVRLRSSAVGSGETVEMAVLSGALRSECLHAVESHPGVEDVSVVHECEQETLLQVLPSQSRLLTAANRATAPLSYPIPVEEGRAHLDVVGTHETIRRFGSELTDAGIEFDISRLQRDHDSDRVLTARQQELVQAAVELGYYETPRRCSLTELASEMDVAKSTCSAILHRAEEALVKSFLASHEHGERGDGTVSEGAHSGVVQPQ